MAEFPDVSQILNAIPLACYMLDHQANFIYINQKAEQFFKKDKSEMLGKNVWSLFPESKNSAYYHEINEAINEKKAATFEYVSVFSQSWIKLTISPVTEGIVVSFNCIEKDKQHENLYQTLVENTPDIVTKWDKKVHLIYANTALTNKTGISLAQASGKAPQEIWPYADVSTFIKKTKKVFKDGHAHTLNTSFATPNGTIFYDIKLVPELTLNGQVKSVIAIGRDITILTKNQENFNAQLRHKYRSLFNSINQGFCIIEMIWDQQGNAIDYRFIEANPAFKAQTGINDYEGKTILEIWPQHEPHWFEIYGNIAKTQTSAHLELPATLINGWYEVEAFSIGELGKDMVGILFNDISERKNAEEVLRKNDERQSYLLKLMENVRFLLQPLEIQEAAARTIGQHLQAEYAFYGHVVDIDNVPHLQIDRLYQKNKRRPFKPSLHPLADLGIELAEMNAGKTCINSNNPSGKYRPTNRIFLRQILDNCVWVAVPLIKNGHLVAVLMVHRVQPRQWLDSEIVLIEETAERTWAYIEQSKIANALSHSEEQLSVALTASNMSTFHWLAKNGDVVVSPLSATIFGLKEHDLSSNENEGFSMVHPEDRERHLQTLKDACKHQKEFHHTYRIIRPNDQKIAWIEERGKGIYHPIIGISEIRGIHWDITSQKNQENDIKQAEEKYLVKLEEDVHQRTKELKESRDELAAIYNNTLMAISVLKAVRDKNNQIIDFKITLTNKALERETGRTDLIGKRYLEEYPGVKAVGLFDMMVKVMETGVPVSTEYFYPYEDFNKWYACMFVKMDDSLLATNLDISERKIAEQLFNDNSAMIQGIANSAPDMLYAINLDNMQQFYSNYRIEQLVEKNQLEIKKMGTDFFERFIHPEDKASFYASLDELRGKNHKKIKSLVYRLIDAQGKTHWISSKSTVYIRDDEGESTHVVGISQDITQQKALEEKNIQLTNERRELEKKQQKEILKATLNAQEEERKRFAESLHNGLGQVLYGIKATLERINLNKGSIKDNAQVLHRSKELLGMCIQESRRISHELMPSILEDFGLKAAIKDICTQLKGETHFNCTFSGTDIPLDKYIQLAIYRIAQELAQNIVKHASAKIAHIDVSIQNGQANILAKDNGRGFEKGERKSKGIGLKTIESKVKLLNGSITINSVPQQTVIHIQFPI
ncbi:PAS domain S-box protein [Pedobacter nanyangensis]|uniref:PAS domain S-box protein n=1 Tax=Pedobacter nanyangensis TaxID=1562389 RepID=UPI0013B431EC|nr:PAS domain S-box protein [Pedobacter nanyangensis]